MAEGDLRLFVAVPASPEAIAAAEDLLRGVRAAHDDAVRWVRPEGLHVTLRFLGATAPSRVPAVEAAMAEAARGEASFEVALAGGGAFPDARRPRTLWLGITDGADRLAGLAGGLETALAAAGWRRDERPFRPHLTVGRARSSDPEARAAAFALVAAARGRRVTFRAESVRLYASHQGDGPARYEVIAEVPIAG